MTSSLAALGARSLGALSGQRWGLHALALGLVGAGGAATGWLAAGSWRGAATGAAVHLGLYGLAGAFFGAGRLQTAERVAFGILGLGMAASVAYLHFGRSRRS